MSNFALFLNGIEFLKATFNLFTQLYSMLLRHLANWLIVFSFISLSTNLIAQKGAVGGVITDETTAEPLIGASVYVYINGNQVGTVTDWDGSYLLENLPEGSRNIIVSYTGYRTDTLQVVISAGNQQQLDIKMATNAEVLEGVLVVGKVDRTAVAALQLLQQRSPSMLTGITSKDIERSPDRTTGDVLKRVSGTTVQDNKFVVVRGLADRYNAALLNGLYLPSTEPDRRAFSFDLFPSAMVSNLLIFKTATPNLPGEFAGGVVQVNTREVTDDPFFKISIGSSYNTQSTFEAYQFYNQGSTDWLGYDNGGRDLPSGVTKEGLSSIDTRYEVSKLVKNDWQVNSNESMRPGLSLQLSGGTNIGKNMGLIGAVTYNNTPRIVNFVRSDFNVGPNLPENQLYQNTDNQYRQDVNLGGMLNFTYKISNNLKIALNNLVNLDGQDQFVQRNGLDYEQQRFTQASSFWYESTRLISNQLIVESDLNGRGLKLKVAGSNNNISRNTPSLRRMFYTLPFDAEAGQPYEAFIPFSAAPSPNFAGRFYSNQTENSYNGNIDLYIPYFTKGRENHVQIGGFGEKRTRAFDARVLGYTVARTNKFNYELLRLPIESLLDEKNIGETGFVLRESTNPNDSYDAESELAGGYAMIEQFVGPKLRVIAGARVEYFNQSLNTFTFGGTPVDFSRGNTDVLPSLNLSYAINDRSNLRFAVSQTVSRPNFRELAPFSFFDFNLSLAVNGNPNLQRAKITNLDLKYELFSSSSEAVSITTFYKHFENPIEQFYELIGGGNRNINFKNAKKAVNYGAELEFRMKLERIAGWLRDFNVFANLAYINSEIDVSIDPASQLNGNRPLQGQSPYVVNTGLTYNNSIIGFSGTILYNRIGRRIWLAGSNQYLDTWENPRNLLDVQLTQRVFRNGEIKLNVSDILNNEFIFYQDQNDNGKYDKVEDTRIISSTVGTNISLSLSYKF